MAKSSAAAAASPSSGKGTARGITDGHANERKELQAHKKAIQARLKEIDIRMPKDVVAAKPADAAATLSNADPSNSTASSTSILSTLPTATLPPQLPLQLKTDTQWDFTLKEMAWLSADFRSERKRQISQAKKLSNAILQYFSSLQTKKARERAVAEVKVRRLGGRMGRSVLKGYWQKMERVVGYKQRLEGEGRRRREMDGRLVFLVRQTERYGESLREVDHHHDGDDDDALLQAADNGSKKGCGGERRMTIEEALSQASGRRKKSIDYSRMDRDGAFDESSFYGESIRRTRSSDAAAAAANDETDYYEPTQQELARDADEELSDYTALLNSFQEQSQEEVREEVDKLLEEKEMEVEGLIRRLMEEGRVEAATGEKEEEERKPPLIEVIDDKPDVEINDEDDRSAKKRRVCFASSHQEKTFEPSGTVNENAATSVASSSQKASVDDPKSIVEPGKPLSVLDEDDHEEKDEFHLLPTEEEADDETTIEAEERLGRDMSYQEEIDLLKQENEMSVEELRAMYASMDEGEEHDDTADNEGSDEAAKSSLALLDEDDQEEKDEFHLEKEELDDETTIEAEERLGRDMSYQEEIDLLKQENEMSVEELRAMYANMDEGGAGAADEDGYDAGVNAGSDEAEKSSLALLDEDDQEEKDEFHLEQEELDDETTIEAEEKMERDMSYQEEIDLLQKENEMSVEELKVMYASMDEGTGSAADDESDDAADNESNNNSAESSLALLDEDDQEEKDEFHLEKEELDDETTIEAEERLGRDMSYQEEIDLLEKENEMSVEELRAMYANMDEELGSVAADESDDESKNKSRGIDESALSLLDEDDQEEENEFHLEKEELDDETTIEAEEKMGRDMSYQEEIDLLKQENEMSVEDLRAMYDTMDGNDSKDEESSSENDDIAEPDGLGSAGDDIMEVSSDGSSKRKHPSDGEADDVVDLSAPKKAKSDVADEGMSAIESLAASDTKARETMLTRPFLLASWVKLRAYQHIGLNWLVSIQSRRLNGILADEMGLGKTLQTISMIAYLASYKGIWGPHLIIVPTSCLVNWEVEFKRFCPGLKVLCYYGNAKRRKELRTGWTKSNVHHVIITSYQLAVQDAFAFKRKKWYYLILDEAHNIKNFESQRWQTLIGFNTQRRLLLTGTPLQNNLMELWSLLHFLMPHVFTDRKQFSYWFSNPMDNIIEGNARRNDDLINRLHGIIRPFVLRRLKKDVETQLPGKFEHIVKCQLSRRQMFLYEEFMARSSTRKALKSGGNFMGMMNVLMQLRKVCNHPDLFEPRSVTTPFVMEPVSMSTAACVVNAIESKSALECLSPFLMLPLWTMGRGTPSFEKSTSVDGFFAEQLSEIKTSQSTIVGNVSDDDLTEPMPHSEMDKGLFSLLSRISTAEKQDRVSQAEFIGELNTQRCEAIAFPYSDRLCQAVSVVKGRLCDIPLRDELTASQIAATPLELLAMRKSQEERASDLDEIADKFVFCVPKAGTQKPLLFSSNANSVSSVLERSLLSKTSTTFENHLSLFKKTQSRLTMCFPDKKLVQFDAGKLQKLATLMRDLKKGGHRVLIFTQMSKMLDVLEAFLNLNGHTYLRLDGATDVEKRQRLMDRFNNDSKVFCFILSTRSGGLGINLTGADTVVFYDSDWNPAMDAQAQDRAHRIGQTREVHIYRMVTEHSIEENILTKAKQKRNLDFLVMDEGNFNANAPDKSGGAEDAETEEDNGFTKDKLQNILGIHAKEDEPPALEDQMSKDQLESTMAALEDEDDVKAMHSARQEATEALQEFDESIQYKQDDVVPDESKGKELKDQTSKPQIKRLSNASTDSTESDNPKPKQEEASDDDKEMEKEFAQWQRTVGMDATTIHESLNPLERYGLHVKEQIDPYFSKYYWAEQQRLAQTKSNTNELNIEEIEQKKAEEEQRAFEDGDLLCTHPEPENLARQRQLYIREKARLRSEIMKRKLTGQNWITKIDERTGTLFWYNNNNGEVRLETPEVLKMLEAEETARTEGWAALPPKILFQVFEFLVPYPERNSSAAACHKWQTAAHDISFVLHVWPVELGALVMEESKLGKNHFRTISDALQVALPGDTIELGDGHYFINDPGLVVEKAIKFVGDEQEPAHVILELSGDIIWKSFGGWMEGITIRRPRIATGVTPNNEILRIQSGGHLNMFNCIFDNRGSVGNCISVSSNAGGQWEKISISGGSKDKSGLLIENKSKVDLVDCIISDNDGVGITREDGAVASIRSCTMERNELALAKEEELVLSSAEPALIASR